MEWLSRTLSQEPIVLVISISVVVSIFILAARKAHTNHLAKMKKIDDSFNIKWSAHWILIWIGSDEFPNKFTGIGFTFTPDIFSSISFFKIRANKSEDMLFDYKIIGHYKYEK